MLNSGEIRTLNSGEVRIMNSREVRIAAGRQSRKSGAQPAADLQVSLVNSSHKGVNLIRVDKAWPAPSLPPPPSHLAPSHPAPACPPWKLDDEGVQHAPAEARQVQPQPPRSCDPPHHRAQLALVVQQPHQLAAHLLEDAIRAAGEARRCRCGRRCAARQAGRAVRPRGGCGGRRGRGEGCGSSCGGTCCGEVRCCGRLVELLLLLLRAKEGQG